jgi:hypothetical protein
LSYAFRTLTFLTTRIPPSCQWQLALSVYRLRQRDPYAHQVGTAVGLLQLVLLVDMLWLVLSAYYPQGGAGCFRVVAWVWRLLRRFLRGAWRVVARSVVGAKRVVGGWVPGKGGKGAKSRR